MADFRKQLCNRQFKHILTFVLRIHPANVHVYIPLALHHSVLDRTLNL